MDWWAWLFPRRCVGCGELGSYLCADCINRLVIRREWGCVGCGKLNHFGATHQRCKQRNCLDGLLSVYEDWGLMRNIVRTYVDREIHDLNSTLVELMVSTADYPILYANDWVIMPLPGRMPMSKESEANRRLAKGLAEAWRWPYQKKMDGVRQKPSRLLVVGARLNNGRELKRFLQHEREEGVKIVWALTLV